MGMTIPAELDHVLDLLGYEWPNVDEDAVRDAAQLVRELEADVRGTLDRLEARMIELQEGAKSKSVSALIQAYSDNRTSNLDQLLDALPEVASGIDMLADAVVALKVKVVAELTITAAQIAAAAATAVVTAGASLAANAAIIAARKKALDIATDIAMDELIGQVASMVIEPLTGTITDLAIMAMEAPLVTSGDDVAGVDLGFDLMDQIATAIDDCGLDQLEIGHNFAARLSALPLFAS
ncbi:hypothetical protein [Nocardioides sp.]|uniref:WXG100-like domain-containing protein n=1 Tax=Nocardioides sp. TaxID=35761 RepID=UPI0019BB0839|nr:hypothetical protein [Nocardioides sp.]MBC7277259.1 hypothetical protein [Nocardioides sp.]